MKRYTLKFQPIQAPVSIDALRGEVEKVLLRLHPRITFKMGPSIEQLDGSQLVMFAVDGKREALEAAFSSAKWDAPVQLDGLSWGWVIDNEEATLLRSTTKSIEVDPLTGVSPFEGEGDFVLSKRLLHGKYLALLLSTLALLAILVANTIYPRLPGLMVLYALTFAVFMFSLSNTPLDLRVYGEKIAIHSNRLEVKYWLLSRPATIEWMNIQGLDYASPVCSLLTRTGKIRFLLSEQFGCKDQDVLLKTITDRAGLRYVEGNFLKLAYRKPDAKVSN